MNTLGSTTNSTEMRGRSRTRAISRMATKTRDDGTTYEVKELRVVFSFQSADVKSAIKAFGTMVNCVYPLRNSLLPRLKAGQLNTFKKLIAGAKKLEGKIPEDGYPPKIYISEEMLVYTTHSGKASICVMSDEYGYMNMGHTWQDADKVSPLLNGLRKFGIDAEVERELVTD